MASNHPVASTSGVIASPAIPAPVPPHVPDHELLRCIGRGSYGEVWLARNVMGTYRAVKVIYRHSFESQRPHEREFAGIQKFEPVSRSHDSQVDILHVGRNDAAGYFYYVMELADDASGGQLSVARGQGSGISCQGSGVRNQSEWTRSLNTDHCSLITYSPKTLRSELQRRGRIPVEECLNIALSLTTALEHLHEHGLVHRDIKPSNVIFVHGRPKLADIGLVADVGKTMSFVGTEGYLPPEGPGGPQADIYSLGKVLYEICTGKDREEFPELPTDVEGRSDERGLLELNQVLLKACKLEPGKRYQSAAEMHADLMLLQSGKSVVRMRKLERRLAMATRIGAAAIVLAILAAAGFYEARRAERAVTRQLVHLSVANGQRLMDEDDIFGALLWFTDTLRLEQGKPDRETVNQTRIAWLLRHCPKLKQLWFHDGPINRLDFIGKREGGVRLWDLAEEQPAFVLEDKFPLQAASFSPDGRLMIAICEDRVKVWNSESREFLFQLPTVSAQPRTRVHYARFSSDGRRILVIRSFRVSTGAPVRQWEASSWDVATRQQFGPSILVSREDDLFNPFGPYIRDFSRMIVLTNGQAQVWDIRAGRPITAPLPQRGVTSTGFSHDGRWVLTVAAREKTATVWNADTGELLAPFLKNVDPYKPALQNRDGTLLLTIGLGGTPQLWEARTGEPLTPHHSWPVAAVNAEFSPDGRHLAVSCTDGKIRLWELSKDERPVADLILLAQMLAEHRIDSHGGFTPLSMAVLSNAWQTLRTKFPSQFAATP